MSVYVISKVADAGGNSHFVFRSSFRSASSVPTLTTIRGIKQCAHVGLNEIECR